MTEKESNFQKKLENFKLICDYPRLFISNHFSDLKTEIDTEFALREQTSDLKCSWLKLIAYIESNESECLKKFAKDNYNKNNSFDLTQPEFFIETNCTDNILSDNIRNIEKELLQNKTFLFLTHSNCVVDLNESTQPGKLICVKNEYFDSNDLELLKNDQIPNGKLNNQILKVKELIRLLESNANSKPIEEIELNVINTTHIYFNLYSIKELHSNTFMNFSNLILINLSDNLIEYIESNVFTNLTNLSIIYLSNNRLEYLDPKVFQGLTNLKKIYLDSNRLRELDGDLFKGLNSLNLIDLSNNLLKHLHSNAFNGLVFLENLWLDGNEIESIDSNLFSDLISLELIDLSKNRLKSLEKNIFKNLKKLTDVNLSKNRLEVIETNLFQGLNELEFIDLSWNDLVLIDSDLFKFLNKLVKVSLNDNKLESTNRRSFSNLPIKW